MQNTLSGVQEYKFYHEFVDRIDNSVPRVTAWHHEALPSVAKQRPEGQNCLAYPQTHIGLFFLHILPLIKEEKIVSYW